MYAAAAASTHVGLGLVLSMLIGRTVLSALVAIHWILPFTPANPHEAARIVFASLILGAAFLTLFVKTYSKPTQAFPLGRGGL